MQFYASCHISRIFYRNHTTVSKWLKGSKLYKLRLITKWAYVVLHKTLKRQECSQVILKDIWNSSKSFRVTVNRQLSVMLILCLGTDGWKSSPRKNHCFIFASVFLKKKEKRSVIFAIKMQLLCDSFDVDYKMVKSKYTAEG